MDVLTEDGQFDRGKWIERARAQSSSAVADAQAKAQAISADAFPCVVIYWAPNGGALMQPTRDIAQFQALLGVGWQFGSIFDPLASVAPVKRQFKVLQRKPERLDVERLDVDGPPD